MNGTAGRAPAPSLDAVRYLLDSGRLDGRELVVLAYPHPDIGAVVREYAGHMADPGPLRPSYFAGLLNEVLRALERDDEGRQWLNAWRELN